MHAEPDRTAPTSVVAAAERVLEAIAADPRIGHTSHLQVRIGGVTIMDEHLCGPVRNDFSITNSVLATALGAMAVRGLLPPLDSPVADGARAMWLDRGRSIRRHLLPTLLASS